MKHKYGEFTQNQVFEAKQSLRKSIFFLLLIVDPEENYNYSNSNVNRAFEDILYKLGGMNDILFCPKEMVTVISLVQSALNEYNNPDFNFRTYRKLILDAGAEVQKIKEVD